MPVLGPAAGAASLLAAGASETDILLVGIDVRLRIEGVVFAKFAFDRGRAGGECWLNAVRAAVVERWRIKQKVQRPLLARGRWRSCQGRCWRC